MFQRWLEQLKKLRQSELPDTKKGIKGKGT
jgi:hypothetical protein